jgi:hypothetical protein
MFQKPQNYAVQETVIDIPPSLMPSASVRPIIVNNKQVVVQNQASATATSNSRLEFVLPSTNVGYIKPNSLYLSFKVTPLPKATANNWNFSGPCGSVASLINRAIIRVNGVNVEQIERYADVHNILLAHTSSSGYFNVDSVLLERPFKTPDYRTTDVLSSNLNAGGSVANNLVDLCLPLQFQLFTGQHAFPLWLCPPNSCQVTLELSNYVDAFVQAGGAAAITDFEVSEAQLIFDMAEVSPDFIVSMRQKMSGGFTYNLPYLQIRQQALTDAGTVTFNYGLSASSVKAVLYYCKLSKTLAPTGATGFTTASVGGFTRNASAVSSIRVFADGQLLNSSNMSNPSQQYGELNKALGKINDQLSTSAADMVTNSSYNPRTLYNTQFYTAGLGLSGITDPYGMGGGRPVSTLTVEVNKTLDSLNAQAISHVLYDSVLSIDAMGNVLPQQ